VPLSETFGQTIRRVRGERTQRAVAKKVGISQALLSAWELETRLPLEPRDRSKLKKLAKVLGLDYEKFVGNLAATRETLGKGRSLGKAMLVDAVLAEQKAHLDTLGFEADIWVLGPATLPIKGKSRVVQTWVENLRRGVSYHIVWFLCFTETADFEISGALTQIEDEMRGSKPPRGSIYHYATAVYLPAESETVKANLREYNRLIASWTEGREQEGSQAPINRFYPPLVTKRLASAEHLAPYYTRLASVLVYRPLGRVRENLAAIALGGMRTSKRGPEREHTFFFLKQKDCEELVNLVVKFQYEFEAASKASNAEPGDA